MSAPVNLNKARKARARNAKKREADENAVAFGRSKAERRRLAEAAERVRAALEAHKRER